MKQFKLYLFLALLALLAGCNPAPLTMTSYREATLEIASTHQKVLDQHTVKWVMVYCDNRGYVGVVYQYHGTRNEFLTEQRCTAAGHQMVFVGQSVFDSSYTVSSKERYDIERIKYYLDLAIRNIQERASSI